jgi:hypothetical protein
MEQVRLGVKFSKTKYLVDEVIHFGEVVQADQPFDGDLNDRYVKFCNGIKKVTASTMVDVDVFVEFYKDMMNRASIDYLEGHYDSDDYDDVYVRKGGEYIYKVAECLAKKHKSIIEGAK